LVYLGQTIFLLSSFFYTFVCRIHQWECPYLLWQLSVWIVTRRSSARFNPTWVGPNPNGWFSREYHKLNCTNELLEENCIIHRLTVIWLLSLALALPAALYSHLIHHQISEKINGTTAVKEIIICYPFPEELGEIYPKIVVLTRAIVHYCLPLLIIGTFYAIMAHHLFTRFAYYLKLQSLIRFISNFIFIAPKTFRVKLKSQPEHLCVAQAKWVSFILFSSFVCLILEAAVAYVSVSLFEDSKSGFICIADWRVL